MTNIDRSAFGHDTTADEVTAGLDMSGKLVLVTGASGGLGAETARALASIGARILIAARNVEKAEGVAESIRTSTGNPAIEVDQLDLASLSSVRAFAERFLARDEPLHVLINNAGVMACPHKETDDGFEMQFGTNHIGHFVLTAMLAGALEAGAPSRIVNVSSRGHRLSPVVFDDIQYEARPYDKWAAYGQSKTANVLHAIELERRLGASGVHAYALHPGGIQTELGRHLDQEDIDGFMSQVDESQLRFKGVEAGAATQVYAATAPELEGRGGIYLEDCGEAALVDTDDFVDGVRAYAIDPEAATRLWTATEEMIGQAYPL